jgi:ComF family protein
MKFYGRVPVSFVATLFYYHKRGIVQEIIHSLKYRGKEEIGTVLGDWYSEELKSVVKNLNIDAIIPVPLHKKRLRERGYNQVGTFGLALSKNLEIPYNETLLQRNIYSKAQVKKNFSGRTAVLSTIFDVTFTEKDHNKHFLLIDDVLTTGSTLETCCLALQKIPGTKISIICMAMSHS